MNSQQKIINLLTICRKAGKLVIGFDAVKEAVYGGNASCVITASDISAKTLKEVKFFCNNSAVDVVYSGLDSDEFYDAVGKKGCGRRGLRLWIRREIQVAGDGCGTAQRKKKKKRRK